MVQPRGILKWQLSKAIFSAMKEELIQHKWPKFLSCNMVFSKGLLNTRQAWVSLIKSHTIVSIVTAKLNYSPGRCPLSLPVSSRHPQIHVSNGVQFCNLFPAHTFTFAFPLTSYLPLFMVSSSLFQPSSYHSSLYPLLSFFQNFIQFLFFSIVLFCFSGPSYSLVQWSKKHLLKEIIISVGKDVNKLGPPYTTDGNMQWCNC